METLISERVYTVEEYLRIEDESLQKHEYHNGKIIPVSGASFIHNAIAVNVLTALKIAIRGQDSTYYVTNSDTKIWIETIERFVYPDVAVVSGAPHFFEKRKDIIINPLLVVEILSPGTQKKDRTSKFDLYRTLSSLKEYVLVDQDQSIVSIFSQANDWKETKARGMNQHVNLTSANTVLELSDLYEGIDALKNQ